MSNQRRNRALTDKITPEGRTSLVSKDGALHKFHAAGAQADPAGTNGRAPTFDRNHDECKDLFNNAPVGFHQLDAEGRFVRINQTELKMLGYTAEELLGQFVWKISGEPEKTRHAVLAKLGGTMPASPGFERPFRRKDGSTFPALVNDRLVTQADGAIIGLFAGVQDITELKQSEEKLKLFRALIENAGDAIHVVDPATGRFLDVNESACRAYGGTRQEHLALTVFDVAVGLDRAAFDAALARARQDGHVTLEAQHRRRDGTVFPVEVSLTLVTLDREYLLADVRDITDRQRAEAAAAESRKFLDQIINALPNPVFVKDRQHRGVLVNDAFCRLVGLKREDLIGKSDHDHAFLAPAQADVFRARDELVFTTGREDINEETLTAADGTLRHLITKKALYTDETGKPYIVGIISDITERKRAEQALSESRSLYQSLVNQMPAGVFRKDAAGRFVFVNPVFCQLKNMTAEEILGKTPREVDDYERAKEAAGHMNGPPRQRTLAAEGTEHHELIMRTGQRIEVVEAYPQPDGTVEYFDVVKSPVHDAEGRIIGSQGIQFDVTERKRAEKALQASEKSYRGLFEHMVEGFAYCRMIFENGTPRDWKYVSVNRAFERLTGLKDVIGRRVTEVIPGLMQTDPELVQAYARVALTGKTERFETYVKALQQWFDITVYSPEKEFFVAIFDVITERKQAEQRVADALNFNLTVLRTSPSGILVYKASGPCISANEAAAQIAGCTQEQLLAQNFRQLDSWKRDGLLAAAEAALAEGAVRILEARLTSSFGKQSWVNCRFVPFEYANEPHLFLSITDITDRILAEQFQARLATAVEQASESIVITDTQGTILYVNPAFEKISGYTRAEVLGRNPGFLKSGKHDAEFYRRLWETIGRGETWFGHFINRRKDGTYFEEEATISHVRDAAGKVVNYVAVKRNVTRERQLEAQMQQAQKMEAIGQLAAGVAHDFNNILSVIVGYSEMLAAELDPDTPLRHYVHELREAANRATSLTRQLLVFSRKQKVQPVVLDLNATVKDLEKMMRRLIGENIEMKMVSGNQVGRILADPGHIGQVLMNLVVNARDAMPNGGRLTIATSNVSLGDGSSKIGIRNSGLATSGDFVMLSVSDTGVGMTPEVKARLFEALFTTKAAGKGTGLGLATCQTIVQQSGGFIEVESEVGAGATFRIYFPRVDQPLAAAAMPAHSAVMPRGTETLLLVEDEPAVKNLAANVLTALGYDVLRANNGQEALQLFREHKGPPIRLVVTDVVMPRMGGKVMADWLKTANPDLKIIFTSGYTDDAISQQGVLEPGVVFLRKPYTPEVLARKVRALLDNFPHKP